MEIGRIMKKIILSLIICIVLIPCSIHATTKEDIFNYIDSQKVCDNESKKLLNQYKLQFSRMVKERDLSEQELDVVFYNIKDSVEDLKSHGVCKIDDFKNVPDKVIDKVENKIIDAVTTVIEAPSIYGDNDSNSISGIIIDRKNKTIEVISNNSLADKFEINAKKFNYVGPNKAVVITTYIAIGVFVLSTILIIILKKINKLNAIIVPLLSIDIVSFIIGLVFIVLAKPINIGLGYVSMMQRPSSLVNKKIIVNENHEILQYPNYYDEYAELIISSINLDEKVAFGDGSDVLAGDIAHATTSYMPGEGNTIVYSGHNYKLEKLDKLKKNDEIVIKTSYGEFIYKVTNTKIMKDNEYDNIEYDTGKETLVIYTCYPLSSLVYGNKRLVVFAELAKESWN